MFKRLIVVTLFPVILAGCPASVELGPRVQPIVADSTFVHPPSGFKFPSSVGKFERDAINQYDEQGLNVGIWGRATGTS